jgi:hypothetical protein
MMKNVYIILFFLIIFKGNVCAQNNEFIDTLFIQIGFSLKTNINSLDTSKLTLLSKPQKKIDVKISAVEKYNYSYSYRFSQQGILNIKNLLIGVDSTRNISNIIVILKNVDAKILERLLGPSTTIVNLPNYSTLDARETQLLLWKFNNYCVAYYSSENETNELIIYNCDYKSVLRIFNN